MHCNEFLVAIRHNSYNNYKYKIINLLNWSYTLYIYEREIVYVFGLILIY